MRGFARMAVMLAVSAAVVGAAPSLALAAPEDVLVPEEGLVVSVEEQEGADLASAPVEDGEAPEQGEKSEGEKDPEAPEQGDPVACASYTGWVDAAGEPCAAAGAHRWLDEGVEAQSKFFYDPSTDAWYWAEADGSIARNHDAYVPLSNDVDRELWLTDDAYRRANGKWVRLGANGEMIKGEAFENGCWYYFDPVTGAMAHGFAYLPHADKWVYYDYVTGCMEHGLCYIDDAWYLLDQYTGAVTYGTVWVDAWGGYRHFEAVTGRYEGPADHMDWNAPSGGAYPSLAGQPNLNVRVSISEQLVYIRSGERVLYTMIASTGVNGTTPLGTYYVSGRGYSFYNAGEGMGGRYWVNFLRNLYLFHTVPVDASGNYIVSEAMKLGRPASHGCVRLTIPDARFLYENLPDGTRVTIS